MAREVRLHVKAKDDASSQLKAITKQIDTLSEAVELSTLSINEAADQQSKSVNQLQGEFRRLKQVSQSVADAIEDSFLRVSEAATLQAGSVNDFKRSFKQIQDLADKTAEEVEFSFLRMSDSADEFYTNLKGQTSQLRSAVNTQISIIESLEEAAASARLSINSSMSGISDSLSSTRSSRRRDDDDDYTPPSRGGGGGGTQQSTGSSGSGSGGVGGFFKNMFGSAKRQMDEFEAHSKQIFREVQRGLEIALQPLAEVMAGPQLAFAGAGAGRRGPQLSTSAFRGSSSGGGGGGSGLGLKGGITVDPSVHAKTLNKTQQHLDAMINTLNKATDAWGKYDESLKDSTTTSNKDLFQNFARELAEFDKIASGMDFSDIENLKLVKDEELKKLKQLVKLIGELEPNVLKSDETGLLKPLGGTSSTNILSHSIGLKGILKDAEQQAEAQEKVENQAKETTKAADKETQAILEQVLAYQKLVNQFDEIIKRTPDLTEQSSLGFEVAKSIHGRMLRYGAPTANDLETIIEAVRVKGGHTKASMVSGGTTFERPFGILKKQRKELLEFIKQHEGAVKIIVQGEKAITAALDKGVLTTEQLYQLRKSISEHALQSAQANDKSAKTADQAAQAEEKQTESQEQLENQVKETTKAIEKQADALDESDDAFSDARNHLKKLSEELDKTDAASENLFAQSQESLSEFILYLNNLNKTSNKSEEEIKELLNSLTNLSSAFTDLSEKPADLDTKDLSLVVKDLIPELLEQISKVEKITLNEQLAKELKKVGDESKEIEKSQEKVSEISEKNTFQAQFKKALSTIKSVAEAHENLIETHKREGTAGSKEMLMDVATEMERRKKAILHAASGLRHLLDNLDEMMPGAPASVRKGFTTQLGKLHNIYQKTEEGKGSNNVKSVKAVARAIEDVEKQVDRLYTQYANVGKAADTSSEKQKESIEEVAAAWEKYVDKAGLGINSIRSKGKKEAQIVKELFESDKPTDDAALGRNEDIKKLRQDLGKAVRFTGSYVQHLVKQFDTLFEGAPETMKNSLKSLLSEISNFSKNLDKQKAPHVLKFADEVEGKLQEIITSYLKLDDAAKQANIQSKQAAEQEDQSTQSVAKSTKKLSDATFSAKKAKEEEKKKVFEVVKANEKQEESVNQVTAAVQKQTQTTKNSERNTRRKTESVAELSGALKEVGTQVKAVDKANDKSSDKLLQLATSYDDLKSKLLAVSSASAKEIGFANLSGTDNETQFQAAQTDRKESIKDARKELTKFIRLYSQVGKLTQEEQERLDTANQLLVKLQRKRNAVTEEELVALRLLDVSLDTTTKKTRKKSKVETEAADQQVQLIKQTIVLLKEAFQEVFKNGNLQVQVTNQSVKATEKQIQKEEELEQQVKETTKAVEKQGEKVKKAKEESQKASQSAGSEGAGAPATPPSGGGGGEGTPPGGGDDDDDNKKRNLEVEIDLNEELENATKSVADQRKKSLEQALEMNEELVQATDQVTNATKHQAKEQEKASNEQISDSKELKEILTVITQLVKGYEEEIKRTSAVLRKQGKSDNEIIDAQRENVKKLHQANEKLLETKERLGIVAPESQFDNEVQQIIERSKKAEKALDMLGKELRGQLRNLEGYAKSNNISIREAAQSLKTIYSEVKNSSQLIDKAYDRIIAKRKSVAKTQEREARQATNAEISELKRLIKVQKQTMDQSLQVGQNPLANITPIFKLRDKFGHLKESYFLLAKAQKQAEDANEQWLEGLRKAPGSLHHLDEQISKINVKFFTYTNVARDAKFGMVEFARVMNDAVKSIIEVGGEFETYERGLRVVEGSTIAASRRLDELLDLTKELIGIDTAQLIKYSNQLRSAGVSAQDTDMTITAITKSLSEMGKGTYETERVLRQLTQGIAGNKIVLQDLRPIVEEIPRIWRAASDVFDTNIKNIDALRDAVAGLGLEPAEGLLMLVEGLGKTAKGADLDTYAAQIDMLKDKFRILQGTIGREFMPIVTDATKVGNQFLEFLNEGPESLRTFAGAMMGLGAGVANFAQIGLSAYLSLFTALQAFDAATALRTTLDYQKILAGEGTEAWEAIDDGSKAMGKWMGRLKTAGSVILIATAAISAMALALNALKGPQRAAIENQKEFVNTLSDSAQAVASNTEYSLKSRKEELEEYIKGLKKSTEEQHKLLGERYSAIEERGTAFKTLFPFAGKFGTQLDKEVIKWQNSMKLIAEATKQLKLVEAFEAEDNLTKKRNVLVKIYSSVFLERKRLIKLHGEEHEQVKILTKALDLLGEQYENITLKINNLDEEGKTLNQQLVDIDYNLRRAQDRISKGFDSDTTDFGFRKEKLEEYYGELIKLYDKNAELQTKAAEEEETDATKLKERLYEIEEGLKYDKEKLAEDHKKAIDDINNEILDDAQAATKNYLTVLEEQEKASLKRREELNKLHFSRIALIHSHYNSLLQTQISDALSNISAHTNLDSISQLYEKQANLIKAKAKTDLDEINRRTIGEGEDPEVFAKTQSDAILAIKMQESRELIANEKSKNESLKQVEQKQAEARLSLIKHNNDMLNQEHKKQYEKETTQLEISYNKQAVLNNQRIEVLRSKMSDAATALDLTQFYQYRDNLDKALAAQLKDEIDYKQQLIKIKKQFGQFGLGEEEKINNEILQARINLAAALKDLDKTEIDTQLNATEKREQLMERMIEIAKKYELNVNDAFLQQVRFWSFSPDAGSLIDDWEELLELQKKQVEETEKAEKQKQKAFRQTYKLFVSLTTEALRVYDQFLEKGKVTGSGGIIGGIIGAGIGFAGGGLPGAITGYQGGQQVGRELGPILNRVLNVETFHSSGNDSIAAAEAKIVAARTAKEVSTVRQNAKDFSKHFGGTFIDELASKTGSGASPQASNQPLILQLHVNNKAVQEIGFTLDELKKNNRR